MLDRRCLRRDIQTSCGILLRNGLERIDLHLETLEPRKRNYVGETRRRKELTDAISIVYYVNTHVGRRHGDTARIGYGDETAKRACHVRRKKATPRAVSDVKVVVHGVVGCSPPFRVNHLEAFVHLDVDARIRPGHRLAVLENEMDWLSLRMSQYDLCRRHAVGEVLRPKALERISAKDGV